MTDLAPKRRTPRGVQPIEIGWCEAVHLPALGLSPFHAKIDTGARTSSLHATSIRPFERDGAQWVRFHVRIRGLPPQKIEAPLVEKRKVTSSNGIDQQRFVIKTELCLGPVCRQVEITLANRANMAFPMLVGRSALRRFFLVNVARRNVLGAPGQP